MWILTWFLWILVWFLSDLVLVDSDLVPTSRFGWVSEVMDGNGGDVTVARTKRMADERVG